MSSSSLCSRIEAESHKNPKLGKDLLQLLDTDSHKKCIRGLDVSRKYVVSIGSDDTHVIIRDVNTLEIIHKLEVRVTNNNLYCLPGKFSQNSKYFVTATSSVLEKSSTGYSAAQKQHLVLYDIENSWSRQDFPVVVNNKINSVDFLFSGKFGKEIVSVSDEQTNAVLIWNMDKKEVRKTIDGVGSDVISLAIRGNEGEQEEFVVSGYFHDIVAFDAIEGKELWRIKDAHSKTVNQLIFNKDFDILFSAGYSCQVVVHHYETQTALMKITLPDSAFGISLSPQQDILAVATSSLKVKLFDISPVLWLPREERFRKFEDCVVEESEEKKRKRIAASSFAAISSSSTTEQKKEEEKEGEVLQQQQTRRVRQIASFQTKQVHKNSRGDADVVDFDDIEKIKEDIFVTEEDDDSNLSFVDTWRCCFSKGHSSLKLFTGDEDFKFMCYGLGDFFFQNRKIVFLLKEHSKRENIKSCFDIYRILVNTALFLQ